MNHAEKVREKNEMAQIVDIVHDHGTEKFWEANLRRKSVQIDRQSQPPQEDKKYAKLMSMEKNQSFCRLGRNHD